jgi:NTP pyrophosphatase (non-canonical NTP hydrolase)|tara:strand:+ start:10654 stop:10968 length:315 start_codon:yes stop_codon:yes gene_type:complete
MAMTFDEYQEFARSTAIYPEDCKVVYPTLGLCGEAGEVAEKIKKHMRDGRTLVGVGLELGDVLWYISALADDLGVTLEEIAQANVAKLSSRMERNKITGDGDNR